mgnify:CR=1 FL=1|tara:strand:- start:5643 stop:6275 length:633 start_codon:yes stop_codon:yes gene_type:complete
MKVFIVSSSPEYERMFIDQGWEVVDSWVKCDMIQFTGGADVSPSLYQEEPHASTYSNPTRDSEEKEIFLRARRKGIPLAGICRGGQFLNVMSGGKMWQDVNNHALVGRHKIHDVWSKEIYEGTSTHHQMIRPSIEGMLIAYANETTLWKTMENPPFVDSKERLLDTEVVYYKHTNALCFQPHPEFNNGHQCRRYYFRYILDYLFNKPLEE